MLLENYAVEVRPYRLQVAGESMDSENNKNYYLLILLFIGNS